MRVVTSIEQQRCRRKGKSERRPLELPHWWFLVHGASRAPFEVNMQVSFDTFARCRGLRVYLKHLAKKDTEVGDAENPLGCGGVCMEVKMKKASSGRGEIKRKIVLYDMSELAPEVEN